MTDLSEKILSDYQVRRTKKQKLVFIDFLKRYIPDLKVEEGGILHNRNIIVGDIDKAKVIVGAHYDTCAKLPIPNFIMPKNIVLSILYGFVLVIPFVILMILLDVLFSKFISDPLLSYDISLFISFGIMILVLLIGVPNKHNANDNTSGIITLCELIMKMTPEEREKVAFVFFDNEENGLLGSSFFAHSHKKILKDKLVINIDCVSEGNHFLIIENKKARKQYHEAVMHIFQDAEDKVVHIEKSSTTYYPSDQMNFSTYIAVAALKKSKLGLYMNHIHTKKDIIFDKSNIEYLTSKLIFLFKEIL